MLLLMVMQLQATAAFRSVAFEVAALAPTCLLGCYNKSLWGIFFSCSCIMAWAGGGACGAGVYWLLTAPPSKRPSCLFRHRRRLRLRRRRRRCHCSCLLLLFRLTLRMAFMLHGASHCIYVGARIKQLPQLPAARLGCCSKPTLSYKQQTYFDK